MISFFNAKNEFIITSFYARNKHSFLENSPGLFQGYFSQGFFPGTFSIGIFTRTLCLMHASFVPCLSCFNAEFFNGLLISDREQDAVDDK